MINDFKDLEKFLKILRKQGVTEASFGSLTVKMGDLPVERLNLASDEDKLAGFPDGELTPDQLIFYSSGGMPADDPFIKREQ